ncbi:MAG TPA: MBL fold metallo-hydrolase [Candidatus Acidoferrales bacterium]|nr:MBL fold metallo-hydrolase [Candidatus Acidoferrales bacterium]
MVHEPIGWNNGVVIDGGSSRLVFDPISGKNFGEDWNVFITHAHSDHTHGFSTKAQKHSTLETLRIYESLSKREVKNAHTMKVGDKTRIDDTEVKALNAGHMVGSCQYQFFTPNFSAIYTGDINCVDTLTTSAAEHEPCDYLIIEATYGHPSYVFPRRSTIYADIVRWTMTEINEGKLPTFQVYSSGKPQDIVRLFNVYTKLPVVCAPGIARANSAHNENGLRLEYLDASTTDGKSILKSAGCVYVTTSGENHMPRNASRAVATGWALRQAYRSFASFPLSSHADYDQLMEFVAAVNPKSVYIFTGHAESLSDQIGRRLGIRAGPLPLIAQTKLFDFGRC